MSQILKEGISVNSHNSHHCQRKQCDCHYHDPDGRGHGNPHQLRVPYKNYQKNRFDSIACLHHAAEEFTGIRVVGWDRINVTVFLFFHTVRLFFLIRINGNIKHIIGRNELLRHIIRPQHEHPIRQCILEFADQPKGRFLFATFRDIQKLSVDKMDAIVSYKHIIPSFSY